MSNPNDPTVSPRHRVIDAPIVSWTDGLSVTRIATHKGQIWLYVRWAGVTREVRLWESDLRSHPERCIDRVRFALERAS